MFPSSDKVFKADATQAADLRTVLEKKHDIQIKCTSVVDAPASCQESGWSILDVAGDDGRDSKLCR